MTKSELSINAWLPPEPVMGRRRNGTVLSRAVCRPESRKMRCCIQCLECWRHRRRSCSIHWCDGTYGPCCGTELTPMQKTILCNVFASPDWEKRLIIRNLEPCLFVSSERNRHFR